MKGACVEYWVSSHRNTTKECVSFLLSYWVDLLYEVPNSWNYISPVKTPQLKVCKLVCDGVFFFFLSHRRKFGGKARRIIIPHLHFFSLSFSGDHLPPTSPTLQARFSQQWLSKLRWLWTSIPWQVRCEAVSLIDSHTKPGQHSQDSLTSSSQGCMFNCNLQPSLFTEWPGSLMCDCSNTGVEQTKNKSQHRKLTVERKVFPLLLPWIEPVLFWSRVWYSDNSAVLTPRMMVPSK